MPPSDPDFPFELDALRCVILVPADFPAKGSEPTLRVLNAEMERGYQLNVEQGFSAIWEAAAQPTLLAAMKSLDRQLEALLTGKKADTIKIVAPARPKPTVQAQIVVSGQQAQKAAAVAPVSSMSSTDTIAQPRQPAIPAPSAARRDAAATRRASELQTLKHRLGKHPLFSASSDSTIFTLPLDPRKRDALPSAVQAVKSLRLFVPTSYDLDNASIELRGISGEAATNIEAAFARRAAEKPETPLLAQVNYLAQNMHIMASEAAASPTSKTVPVPLTAASPPAPSTAAPRDAEPAPQALPTAVILDEERPHLQTIPRPPEWSQPRHPDSVSSSTTDTDDSDSDSYDSDDSLASDASAGPTITTTADTADQSSTPRERGIMLSLPGLELFNVELLELTTLSLTVKCTRCKTPTDISSLRSTTPSLSNRTTPTTTPRTLPCPKCALPLTLSYRADILHATSHRAGYLDLESCTPLDLLATTTFTPTCSTCSTPSPTPVPGVRGSTSLAICRTCHAHLSFRIPATKFLNTGGASTSALARAALPPGRPRTTAAAELAALGVSPGSPLPRRGRCRHYAKSLRWFRFACCQRIYPCDRCHDAAETHPNEFANRMLCGMCSREQNYRPHDCGVCRANLVGERARGFWEGGKGTRDPARMSRKDPRKYRRRGKGAVADRKKREAGE